MMVVVVKMMEVMMGDDGHLMAADGQMVDGKLMLESADGQMMDVMMVDGKLMTTGADGTMSFTGRAGQDSAACSGSARHSRITTAAQRDGYFICTIDNARLF